MANPRVFISSTCYDLSEVRDALVDFVASYGFEPVLSERGDVFYHPDIHTHDSCLNEVGNSQLFILIIGGRFGGTYVADTSKSIVNAEYAAAREKKIPVFTFVKRSVYSDHFVYQKNRGNQVLNEIIYPSIDNNEHASKIFGFIDKVRSSPVNNGFFPFDFARDITNLLRKQWAGMFYEFLEHRASSDQLATATSLLKSVSVAGEKVEELVKSLYRHLDATGADVKIDTVEKLSIAKQFYYEAVDDDVILIAHKEKSELVDALINSSRDGEWYEYIAAATGGKIETREFEWRKEEEKEVIHIAWPSGDGMLVDCPKDPNDEISKRSRKQAERFIQVKQLTDEELKRVLSEVESLSEE